MQNHPGFYYYPSLHDNGRVRFPIIDPESDSVASHLSHYITASYLMIHELARELTHTRTALASTPVAPMLHPAPALEGEPSRQRHCVTLNPEVLVNPISSGSESASGEDLATPAEQQSV